MCVSDVQGSPLAALGKASYEDSPRHGVAYPT